jgi:restriction system protein
MEKNMWMVRAGEGGILFDEFKDKNLVAIGWHSLGNLTTIRQDDVRSLMAKKYTEDNKYSLNKQAGMVKRFRFEFQKGDYVITYNPTERVYLVGEVISEYIYDTKLLNEDFPNIRKVKWIKEISRDYLSVSTRNTLGAKSALFKLGDDAQAEIEALLEGKPEEIEPEADEEQVREDMIEQSKEMIKDKVSQLDPYQMQDLIAGLLRAMGYQTTVSPLGADRGKDIQASPDGLNLEEPRIKVEVKHRKGAMGAPEIRSFLGGMRPGDRGLYVSTGGFSKEAYYEAERADKPIRLMDLDSLVESVIKHYDKFDVESRVLVPLTKMYWPV